MFEKILLERSRQASSPWSWLGVLVQIALVGACLMAPMIHPEVLSVILPKAAIYVPLKPIDTVPVEVKPATMQTEARNLFAEARPQARPFVAPKSWTSPVQTIVDGPDYMPSLAVGPGVVHAGSVVGGSLAISAAVPNAPPPQFPAARNDPPKPVRVGGHVLSANLLRRVTPAYPPLAKQSRISGLVKLEGVIAKDGSIQRLRVVSGHPLLAPAALAAVRQWLYRPTFLNGEPVEVIAPIDVNFVLSN